MKIDTSGIKLTNRAISKGLKLPSAISQDLAYLCGLITGDGNINIRKHKHDYSIKCIGNPSNEKDFYDIEVAKLFKKIFNIKIEPKYMDYNKTYGISISSKNIVEFLISIGMPHGKKVDIISIPPIFKKSEKLLISFIQGYADADFCISLKKRYRNKQYYPVINGTSRSKKIILEISKFLKNKGLKPVIMLNQIRIDKRFKNNNPTHKLELNGHEQFIKWINLIGSRKSKSFKKFEVWKSRNKNNSRARKAFDIIKVNW